MTRRALLPAALSLALTAPAAGAAVQVVIDRAAVEAPATVPVNLGSLPLGSINTFEAHVCFLEEGLPPSGCPGSGTVSVTQQFAAPFYTVAAFRQTVASGAVAPVSLPVTLAAGQRLRVVLEWIVTGPGPAASSTTFHITPHGEPPTDIKVDASGTGAAPPPCGLGNPGLCLGGDRFLLQVRYLTTAAVGGQASALGLTTDTGYFFFFDPANVEAVVKVLNACGLNSHYWVFAGGLTDVRTDLTVTDLERQVVQVYFNPLGNPFQPIQDTAAFATCP